MEITKDKLSVSPYSKIRVNWEDYPHNYSKEGKSRIKSHFAKKYGVNVNNIVVNYKPVKVNEKGEIVEISGAGIDNIMDVNYQRSLMREIITRDKISVDFDRIIILDDKINAELNIDLTASQHKKWSLKWLMINNFLSFGDNNYIPFSKLKGLNIVNSQPQNAGGKTNLTIDSIKFLLHGKTTKTDVNLEIFNMFTETNELVVRGMVDIESDEFIIERRMKRSQSKKSGEWNVTNKVNYYKILPDGNEEQLNDEDAKKTTKKLNESIGLEADFEMLVLATEKNLDELIGLTATESGKLLTRLIGLEVLELKEAIVRKKYNEFDKKKKSNQYNIITLNSEIEEHGSKNVQNHELLLDINNKLVDYNNEIIRLNNENDRLINSKEKIDVVISELNPSKIESDLEKIKDIGIDMKNKVSLISTRLTEIGEVNFDEDKHNKYSKDLLSTSNLLAVKQSEITRLEKSILELIAGGICQSCNRKLDDIDNTEHINKHKESIDKLKEEVLSLEKLIATINQVLGELNKTKLLIDERNKLELNRDRLEVEMTSLRNDIISKRADLKKYNDNLEAIEFNKKVDIDISQVKTSLSVAQYGRDNSLIKIQKIEVDIKTNNESILSKKELIDIIKKEEEVDRIFKIYIELVGKKGISKLILRSILPIINSEIQRLLEDIVDFEVEIFIDDKNDVQFLLVRDGVSKKLKSGSGYERTAASLALRAVLGRVSTLPMPNFITFDEVLGKVAAENIDGIKLIFDRIKTMYDSVFFITHNDIVKDWADNLVTVNKVNNISSVSIN